DAQARRPAPRAVTHASRTSVSLASAFSRIRSEGMRRIPAALAASVLLAACASTPPTLPRQPAATSPPAPRVDAGTATSARANLAAASATLASGRIDLRAVQGGVRLAGEIGGLSRHGAHVLQVHARGDCSAIDASSAGPYFDA